MIKLENVKKVYSGEVEIGPVDISFGEAGFTAIIGPNGAGKSTTLHIIGRLLKMDSGSITVAERDVATTDSKELAKIITILRQENHFVTRLTVRQLVGFGRFPYTGGRLTEEDEEIISRYIDFFGLKELENRYLTELSGGQRQRAYVAMVLTQETKYVLLDEPLNNLDVARSVSMMRHLRDVCDKFKKTIIAVMHDINFAAQYADHICCMKDGRVVAFGEVDEIMDGELLSDIYDTKIEIIETPRGKLAVY